MLDIGFKIFYLKKNKDKGNIASDNVIIAYNKVSQTPVIIKAPLIFFNV